MSTAVTTERKHPTVHDRLSGADFKAAVASVLPRHLTPDRFVRIAILATHKQPKLLQCTQSSLFTALMNLSQLGLEPDGRRAHLIPFENKKKRIIECQLVIDYKGLAELAMRGGTVSTLHSEIVCEADEFEWDMGEIKRHRIDWRKPRGEAYAAYSLAKTKDGAFFCEVMPKEDIYSIRDAAPGWIAFKKGWAYSSPWDPKAPTIEREMWKKTTFRRMTKLMTLSPELREAVGVEDEADRSIAITVGAPDPNSLVSIIGNGASEDDASEPPTSEEDEAAEAAAGLAPERKAEDKPTFNSAQDQLAAIVTGGGFTFEQWREWAIEQGHLENKHAELPAFDLVPDAVCVRLIRAKAGMLGELAKRKVEV